MLIYRIHTREYKRYILYSIHRFERYCSVVEVTKSVLVVLHQVQCIWQPGTLAKA